MLMNISKNTAIVILNWNGRKMLERFLPSVVDRSSDMAEVIVADNASTDDSLTWLGEHFPQVPTFALDQNYGFAEGYNRALQQVEAKYYVLLNSDVEVTPHWLDPLVRFMDEHDEVAACQPKLRAVADHGAFEYAGAAGGFIDRLGYPFCRGRIFDMVEHDDGQYDEPMEVHWATGACLMIRAEDYWSVGGLDGRFFAHNEEIDLCWRLRLRGRKIFCLPQCHVFHVGGGTLPKDNPRKTFLNFRNNLTMLYKNLPEEELAPVMRWRWWLDHVAAMQALILQGHWGDCKAVFKARHQFRKWKKDFRQDRLDLQKTRNDRLDLLKTRNDRLDLQKTRNDSGVSQDRCRFSILWQYYIKGRKRFSQLPKSQE